MTPQLPVGPVDATVVPRFAGPATFARLPRRDEVTRMDVAVVGVPFDSGVSYRPGARFGPAHVRESSRLLRPYNPAQDTEPFAAQQVVDAGDIACNPFDAHLDTWDAYFGAPTTHGTPFRRAAEEGLLDPEGCVHVGIRGPLYAPSDLVDDRALGFTAVTCPEVEHDGLGGAVERILARVADRPVYVSVDIDVLDPCELLSVMARTP